MNVPTNVPDLTARLAADLPECHVSYGSLGGGLWGVGITIDGEVEWIIGGGYPYESVDLSAIDNSDLPLDSYSVNRYRDGEGCEEHSEWIAGGDGGGYAALVEYLRTELAAHDRRGN